MQANIEMSILRKLRLIPGSLVIAIASHPDDIALSCGGFIRQLSNTELTLLTCFSRSIFAPFAEISSATAEAVQAIRRSEDENYARRVNATRLDLGLDDVSLRYPDYHDWLCDKPQLDESFTRLHKRISEVITSKPYTHILCPLAVGHHIDHYFVREAVRQVALASHSILYYEDLPYGVRIGGPTAVCDFARQTIPSGDFSMIDTTGSINMKLEDIRVYESQIYPEDLEGVIRYAADLSGKNGYAERIWFQSGKAPISL